jgi:hypothetical protein
MAATSLLTAWAVFSGNTVYGADFITRFHPRGLTADTLPYSWAVPYTVVDSIVNSTLVYSGMSSDHTIPLFAVVVTRPSRMVNARWRYIATRFKRTPQERGICKGASDYRCQWRRRHICTSGQLGSIRLLSSKPSDDDIQPLVQLRTLPLYFILIFLELAYLWLSKGHPVAQQTSIARKAPELFQAGVIGLKDADRLCQLQRSKMVRRYVTDSDM